ncbi:hypothetical protein [Tropicimonas sp. IMCC6043]|uniref:hypothetical protein n=1 Tax=Tropicimonas sp. IMCC6043 TaxID=2510645 RepID=UPI0013EC1F53|nr:hypothetical protein [Tropicimonas sp. IMCC6043]
MIDRDEVIWAYRELLGREPESADRIEQMNWRCHGNSGWSAAPSEGGLRPQ